MKRTFIDGTGEALALHIHCSGFLGDKSFELFFWDTELFAVLLWDRTLSHYSSFSGKMVLKRAIYWWYWGNLGMLIQVFWETELWVSMIVLVGRWPWKGHALGKSVLHIHCLGILGDRALKHSPMRQNFKLIG